MTSKKRYLKPVIGTASLPRLAISRSHKHLYAQLINDKTQRTILTSSTHNTELCHVFKKLDRFFYKKNLYAAFYVGQSLAKKANRVGILKIVVDRDYYKYSGKIKALIEGMRFNGLIF